MTTTPQKVLMIGLGKIADTHLKVLNASDRFQFLGGVDPSRTPEGATQRWATLEEALSVHPNPDVIVIATPTRSHAPLVDEVLSRTRSLILCEKPLALNADMVSMLERAHTTSTLASRLRIAHHFAFSPEVEWAISAVQSHAEWGPPSRITCFFNDAYAGLSSAQRESYVSSWDDSGPNQLSITSLFGGPWQVEAHQGTVERSVTTLTSGALTVELSTNWLAGDSSKQTLVDFDEAGISLRMDHTSMTGVIASSGRIIEQAAYNGASDRKTAHYQGVYEALARQVDDVRLSYALGREIAFTLDAAWKQVAAGEPRVAMTSVRGQGGN